MSEERLLHEEEGEEGDTTQLAALDPEFNSPKRTVSIFHAILALFSTMIGGGMLTLPFATSKVGVVGSLLLSCACAVVNETTYFLLIRNARETNSKSFHEIAGKTLGSKGRLVSMACMIGITLMASMSYLLLIGSLMGEIFFKKPNKAERNIISIAFTLVILFPLSLNDNLSALKYSNLVSALASLLLLFALCFELWVEPLESFEESPVKFFPETLDDLVFAVPFFLTAYTAHFSVLGMDQELTKPTLQRARQVTRGSVLLAFFLFSSISLAGYFFALDSTCDSILSNIPPRRLVSIVGRIGLTMTLALSYPLFVLPNRATVCELMQWGDAKQISFQTRFGLTLAFCTCSVLLCCIMPSVAVAFSLTGSTLGITISLLLPALFTLGNAHAGTGTRVLALGILVIALVGAVVCTATTYRHRNDVSPCDSTI